MRKTIALLAVTVLLGAACAQAPKSSGPGAGSDPGIDAKALYAARCAGCHGVDGSKGLKGKSADYVLTALNGYKAKTYGGAKKAIMEAQAANLADPAVLALAKFVAGL